MSLVIALKGTDSVVLAADTLAVSEDPAGMSKFKCSKLRAVNNVRWVVGFAGWGDAPGLIEVVNRRGFDFGQDAFMGIATYAHELWTEYQRRHFSGVMDFLLAGMDSSVPFIQRWSFDVPRRGRPMSLIGPSFCDRDHEAIGVCGHGGLYFAAEYHREDMDTRQMVSLAHFCVSEVAKQELLVGGPVDMAIVNRNGAICLPESRFPGLRQRSESIVALMRSAFSAAGPDIPPKALPSERPPRSAKWERTRLEGIRGAQR